MSNRYAAHDCPRIDGFDRLCYSSAMQLTIRTPPDFNFHRTVFSHGWCELLPFELDGEMEIERVLDVDQRKAGHRGDHDGKGALKVEVSRRVGERAAEKIVRDVRHMFRLDDDLETSMR